MRFQRNSKVEIAPMKSETVLFNPANNKFCVLNPTAAFIWDSLQQPRTVEEIVAALEQHFDRVDPAQAQQDVKQALQELQQIDCVTSPQ